ncbi:MAG TPA: trypsin-like peptidase domain-containing protein [Candidatus Azoamicus sp. OHIO2]
MKVKNLIVSLISVMLIMYTLTLYAENRRDFTHKVSYAETVSKAASAVVSIQTSQEIPIETHPMFSDPLFKFFFGEPEKNKDDFSPYQKHMQQGLGSGVIVDKRGYILTNNHVIKNATSIMIKFRNGITSEAEIIGTDSKTDLAILKIKEETLINNISVILIGDSDTLQVGDVVLAIGNPFGFDNTVTQGIVSGLGSVSARSNEQQISLGGWLDNLIQTDAAINPGNSGGALIDVNGFLVGINVAIITKTGGSQGIGFAVPINIAKEVMDDLIKKGHVVRGWLGVQLSDTTKEMCDMLGFDESYGVYVQSVVKYGPAWEGGIVTGDIITKVDNVIMKTLNDSAKFVSSLEPGKEYIVEVFRNFKFVKCHVIMGQVPQEY